MLMMRQPSVHQWLISRIPYYKKVRPIPLLLIGLMICFTMWILMGMNYETLEYIDDMAANISLAEMQSYVEQDTHLNLTQAIELSTAKVSELHGFSNKPSPIKKKTILIISNWRQGSSFLQNIIGSQSYVLKINEPLITYQNLVTQKLRSWSQEPGSMDFFLGLMTCNFQAYAMTRLIFNKVVFESNDVMQYCLKSHHGRQLCYQPQHMESLCKMFPITLYTVVRLQVQLLEPILEAMSDQDFHVVYFPRDPRPTMNSRWNPRKVKWCKGSECESSDTLCADMDTDLTAIYHLKLKYQPRVHILRYEDLAYAPQYMVSRLFETIGLSFTDKVRSFVDKETSDIEKTGRGTSEERADAWMKEIPSRTFYAIQDECSDVMKRFGYLSVYDGNFTRESTLGPLIGAIT